MRRALASAFLLVLLAAPAVQAQAPPRLDATAWVLVDPRDGEVLAAKGEHKRLSVASATKLMTAYVALRELEPKQKLTAAPYTATDIESLLGLQAGEKISVRDLIYALLLESANDAAVTLAVGVSGSESAFVEEMNGAAAKLGLEDSHFTNPIGLDEAGNRSSAADLAELAGLLLDDPLFAKAADSPTASLKTGAVPRTINTRNLLLNSTPFVTGVKTGHTLDAGYVLVGSGERDGTTLISTVLGAPSEPARDAQTLQLLNFGFSQYTPSTPVKEGDELASPELSYRNDSVVLVAERGLEVSAREGEPVDTEVEAPEEVNGPIEKGEKVGTVTVNVGGRPAESVPLVAAEAVSAASFPQKVLSAATGPLALIPVGLLVVVVGLLLARRDGWLAAKPAKPRSRPKRKRAAKKRATPAKPTKKPRPSTSSKTHLDPGGLAKNGPESSRSEEERERMRKERMRRRKRQTQDERDRSGGTKA